MTGSMTGNMPRKAAIAEAELSPELMDAAEPDTLVIDDLHFAVRRSARRATIGVTVERDGSLTLSAPVGCPSAQIERIARDKLFWIYTKLAEKNALAWPAVRKEYVTGEGFWYLGRSYRLRLLDDPAETPPTLRLHHGRFLLHRTAVTHARDIFIRWYTERGVARLPLLIQDVAQRLTVQPQGIRVLDLGHRWGSCGHTHTLNLHWRTVLLPPRIVEYVVAHELVHLREPHHGPSFWRLLERTVPDYAARKSWLAEHGARYTL